MKPRDPLLGDLADLWQRVDPMPSDLPERIIAALAMDGVDLAYELLTLNSRTHELLGVRGDDDERVLLEFGGEHCTVLVRIAATEDGKRRVDGWCEPGAVIAAELRAGADRRPADQLTTSRFEFNAVPAGLTRLHLTVDIAGHHHRLRSPSIEL